MNITAGTKLAHYEILAPIGQGGMGRVYRARDSRLEREVAIKLLAAQFTQDETRVSRFIREAKAASGLNHPNIITVHEIGESQGEVLTHFIVTELVEGQTLRALIKSQQLTAALALDYTIQITGALIAAHKAGIVHRDIKPENVMVRQDGIVKVLDFGLAKLSERGVTDSEAPTRKLETDPGVVMGTPQYMSPEQARGLAVDVRTDLFSLGIVLYEMLAGRPPFDGPTSADVISELLHREPKTLFHYVPSLPPDFLGVVSKLLRKDRTERYQTAKDLLVDLKVIKRELDTTAPLSGAMPHAVADLNRSGSYETSVIPSSGSADVPTKTLTHAPPISTLSSAEYLVAQFQQHRRAVLFGLGASTIAAAGGTYWYRQRRSVIDSLAVMPFELNSKTPEAEQLRDAIADSLINDLSQHKSLNIKPRSLVEQYGDKPLLDVAKAVGARAILSGSITQQGETLSVSVALIDARDNRHLWGDRYTRRLEDLTALEQDITREVTNQLQLALSEADRKKFEAYSLTLRGRNEWNKRTEPSLQAALRLFEQAVQNDARFAPAYAGLADCYNMLANYAVLPINEAFTKAREAAQKALDLDERLAEAHAARAFTAMQWEWNWGAAEEGYRRAIDLKPNYAPAHQWYSSLLAITGRMDEALRTARRAQEIDRFSLIVSTQLAWINYLARRYDETIAQANVALKMDKTFFPAHRYQALAFQAQGKHAEAVAELQQAVASSRGSILVKAELAHALARAGKRDEAKAILQELEQLARQRSITAYYFALIHLGLNDKERALQALDKAFDEKSERLVWLKVDPRFDGLRNEVRFRDLLERIGLAL